jgi:chromosome partitioning protein
MIVTVAHTKGGTGKTTTALQLALYWKARLGHDVWLIDGDEQKSALTAVAVRSDTGAKPALPCSAYSDGRSMLAQIRAQRKKWEDIVIDVGGRDTSALRAALMVCDILLVPVMPRSYDVWALSNLQKVIQEARDLGASFRALVFLCGADSQGSDNQAAMASIANFPEFELIETPLVRRKAFAAAGGTGLSVFELKPTDAKACRELTALSDAVLAAAAK